MSDRTVVLIDHDDQFRSMLETEVRQYGFDVEVLSPEIKSLTKVKSIQPTAIFIAVEEPDKIGYQICSKAKKGFAKKIPVILTTSTVPESGFNAHKKLPKVRADEYIDKRTLAETELIAKLGALIELGPKIVAASNNVFDDEETSFVASSEDIQIVDEVPMEEVEEFVEEDVLVEEAQADFDEFDDEHTRVDPNHAALMLAQMDDATSVDREVPAKLSEPIPEQPSIDEVSEGLDAVAEIAETEGSGLHNRKMLLEMQELKRENKRLKLELQASQRAAKQTSQATFSREREFLNLREVINKKDRELLNLQDELGERERQILDTRERIRELEHARASLDQKNLELEQQLLANSERADDLASQLEQSTIIGESLESELAAVKQEMDKELNDAAERTRAAEQAHSQQVADMRTQHEEAFANAQAAHTEELRELTRTKDAEIDRITQALQATESDLAQTKQELQDTSKTLDQANMKISDLEATVRSGEEEIERLGAENEELQDQVLRAYQRIKQDESTMEKAKKAVAIALTLLDEGLEEEEEITEY